MATALASCLSFFIGVVFLVHFNICRALHPTIGLEIVIVQPIQQLLPTLQRDVCGMASFLSLPVASLLVSSLPLFGLLQANTLPDLC